MGTMSGVKVGIGVTIDPDVCAKARKEAAKTNRNLSNYVETALRQKLNGTDLKDIAKRIHELYQKKDFPKVLDIQKILKEELEK